jgi:hypothetical protein
MASSKTIKLSGNRRLMLITGKEGPSHDPYHYDEISYEEFYNNGNRRKKIILHRGIVDYIRIVPNRPGTHSKTHSYTTGSMRRRLNAYFKKAYPGYEEERKALSLFLNEDFEKLTGYTEKQWLRFIARITEAKRQEADRCPKTVNHQHNLKDCKGMAGEPMSYCLACGHVYEYEGDIDSYIR